MMRGGSPIPVSTRIGSVPRSGSRRAAPPSRRDRHRRRHQGRVGVEATPENLPADLPVEVAWEDVEHEGRDGETKKTAVPLFKPAGAGA